MSIAKRQASKASPRWGEETAIITLDSPISRRPIRWTRAIRLTIGITYYELGLYADAERHLERAVELRRQGLGDEHVDTLIAMATLTEVYGMQGKFTEAEPLTTKALEIQRRVLGEEHPETLRSMDGAPNLPSGYASMIALTYFPPLWRKVMDHRVLEHYDGDITKVNLQPRLREKLLAKYGATDGTEEKAAA